MAVSVTVRPRLQKETWSLYWKESTNTETICMDDLQLQLQPNSTVEDLLKAVGAQLHWQAPDTLTKLEGFKGPWERALLRGRQLDAAAVLDEQLVATGALVVVRTQLLAEGWKIQDEYDLSDDSDDE